MFNSVTCGHIIKHAHAYSVSFPPPPHVFRFRAMFAKVCLWTLSLRRYVSGGKDHGEKDLGMGKTNRITPLCKVIMCLSLLIV